MAKSKGTTPKEYSWRISQIRKKATFLGSVHAPDERSALERAIQDWEISPAVRNRLVAQREG